MMRALKAIVIGMGIMIVMAVALIGYGLYKKSVDPGWKLFGKSVVISSPTNNNAPLESFDNIELGLSNGCKITDVRPDGRRAYVLTGPVDICNGIIVIDIKDGRVIGHINNQVIVQIDPLLADTIRHAASKSYPHECCGLLTGEVHDNTIIITGVHPSENVTSGDPARRFEVDPKLRFDLMRLVEAMDDQTEIIGHYHSHPDNPAKPSKTDLSMVYEVDFIWLICASTVDGAQDIGAFRPKSDKSDFDTLELVIK